MYHYIHLCGAYMDLFGVQHQGDYPLVTAQENVCAGVDWRDVQVSRVLAGQE